MGLGAGEEEVQYLAKVPGGASAILVTQALVVLCFAVAARCCFLEVGKGRLMVPGLHVLCPCTKAQDGNTHGFLCEPPHILSQVPTGFFLWFFVLDSLRLFPSS